MALAILATTSAARAAAPYLERANADEVVYFLLPDRFENGDPTNDLGGYEGGRLDHGFDPTHKGYFHGGDLKGLTERLDYIQSLGATAIWLGPIYKNKPVQGPPGDESAGYHGYWITDFTTVDPHFGTPADLKEFVDAAHARNMRVFLDIITNHSADVIAYRECHDPDYTGADKVVGDCAYRDKAAYPFSTRGAADGAPINNGFLGDEAPFQNAENFAGLERADFAYTPYVPAGEENVKVPAWLNDPIYYHNRGNSRWTGESVTYGDFSGLDDLMTEHPRVVAGMIDIFKEWISTYKVDGFRIDTAKHVNPEFWQAFVPAILEHADKEGIPNFYMFGEVATPSAAEIALSTRVDKLPYGLDFAFQQAALAVVARGEPSARFEDLFALDPLYEGGEETARNLPVFIGNHDFGRFSSAIRDANPDLSAEAIMKRVELAHAMMFFLRGAPVIYTGAEQGFIGDGNDQAAREDMFPSRVDSYNDNDLLGTDMTTADSNFDRRHPLYRAFAEMAKIYHANEPLRRGEQRMRLAEQDGGILSVSRLGADSEYLVIFNASDDARTAASSTDYRSLKWRSVSGNCPGKSTSPGSVSIKLAPWSYAICKSNVWSDAQ